jgi:hypothetical protein
MLCDKLDGPARGLPSARTDGYVGGDRALPCILPLSQDPVDDSDRRERFDRLAVGMGTLPGGGFEGRRTCALDWALGKDILRCICVNVDEMVG